MTVVFPSPVLGAHLASPEPRRRLVCLCDASLDAAVYFLATWTVVYHLCLIARLDVRWSIGLELLALVASGLWFTLRVARKRRSGVVDDVQAGRDVTDRQLMPARARVLVLVDRILVVTTIGLALAAAVAMAVPFPWPWVAGTWLGSAVAGTTWAVLGESSHPDEVATAVSGPPVDEHRGAIVALVWGVVLAALSLVVLRSNADDVYYVNLSQWVAEHGTFPLRDTIFSDLVYPMSSWPPMASYDALVGVSARVAGVQAAFVAYVVGPALVSFLSALALWRLLRTWQVRSTSIVLSTALFFLVLDGVGQHTPGNLFVTRLFQAKIAFLCLMVPVLLVYAMRYVERPSMARLAWLFVGGIAAVGVTTSAMFLTPMIALAGAAPLVRRSPRKALAGFAALAAYPVAAGVVTKAVDGRSADNFNELRRFDPAIFGPEVFSTGVVAAIAVAAVLLGTILLPSRAARITTGILAVFVGVTYVPGFTHVSFDIVGLGPTLWRVSWLLTVGALVGVAATAITARLSHPLLRLAGPLTLVILMLAFSEPIWAGSVKTSWAAPFHYQRPPDTVTAANRLIRVLDAGDVVVAPEDLSVTIAVLTTRIHSLAPRNYFLAYLRDNPSFHAAERLALSQFVQDRMPYREAVIARDLDSLSVDVVCMDSKRDVRVGAVRRAGYRPLFTSGPYLCLRRGP